MNLTKLEGVNRILRAAREHPVSSLSGTSENDTLMAEAILDEVLLREQMIGLHVNTVEASFDRDATTGKIVLPANTTAVAGYNQHVHRNFFFKEVSGDLILFDGDETPATSDFSANGADTETVYVRITQKMEFDDLPSQHQFSITDQAAVEYQMSVLGDPTLHEVLSARANRSRAIARAYDMRSRPNNQFEDGRSQGPRLGRWTPRGWPYNDMRRQ